jgi:hypothetical protein
LWKGWPTGTVPGAQYAALSVVERRREIHTPAGTANVVFKVDQVQYGTRADSRADRI